MQSFSMANKQTLMYYYPQGSSVRSLDINFKASRSNALFGKSQTQQTSALRLLAIIKSWWWLEGEERCFGLFRTYRRLPWSPMLKTCVVSALENDPWSATASGWPRYSVTLKAPVLPPSKPPVKNSPLMSGTRNFPSEAKNRVKNWLCAALYR